MRVILETNLPLKLHKRGKVRDSWEIDDERLLIVTTDRISAFDVVLPQGIPGKGQMLNQLSVFWFNYVRKFRDIWRIEDHFISDDIRTLWVEGVLNSRNIYENGLFGRIMIVQKMEAVIPIECVMRAVMTGSAWREYRESGTVCGEKLKWQGLKEGDRFPEPIFTPATKAETGHDLNISRTQMAEILARFEWPRAGQLGGEGGRELTRLLENQSRVIFFLGRTYAGARGIDIRDTKFEFGVKGDRVFLIDEVFTPDSSRFLDVRGGQNFDKQYVRDWLEKSGWNKEPPAPDLPDDVIRETSRRYQEIYQRLVK